MFYAAFTLSPPQWSGSGELERNQHPGAGLSRYYRVVELAMESNSDDVVETALGQLHKLVGECPHVCKIRQRVLRGSGRGAVVVDGEAFWSSVLVWGRYLCV